MSKTAKAGPGTLRLTVAPGTRLRSEDASAQSMVVAGVQGRVIGGDSYTPTSIIEVGAEPSTYVLDAYCAEFEKDNPSSDTTFSFDPPDQVLACILRESKLLSVEAKQAAVWIYTDKLDFRHMNEKFSISMPDWVAAQSRVRDCQAEGGRPSVDR